MLLSGTVSIQTAAAAAALRGLKAVFVDTATTAIGFDGKMAEAQIGLTTALQGNSKAAQALLKDLRAFADVSPFQMDEVAPLAQRLLAMQIPAKQLKGTLEGIGEQTSALGGGAATFDRISLAIGQMNLKAAVSSQDLRQLADNGVPAVKYLANAWNTNTETMKAWIAQGIIPGKQAVQALSEQMAANNFGAMQKQSLELEGALSTLSDNFKFFAGGALKDTYGGITEVINRLNVMAKDKEVGAYLVKVGGNFKTAFSVGVEAVQWYWGAQKQVFGLIGQAFSANIVQAQAWVGLTWDVMKGSARAAAWWADTTSGLLQRVTGGNGDFFQNWLEKGITTVESKGGQLKKQVDDFTKSISVAWNETWGKTPDWSKKYEDAGKEVEKLRSEFGKAPTTHSFAGQFIEDQDKARRAALKVQKDMLGDEARAYDMAASYWDKRAKKVQDDAKAELDALKSLRDGARDVIGQIQQNLVNVGITTNPLGQQIEAMEKRFGFGDKSASVVASASQQYADYMNRAGNLRQLADGARAQQERISGLDGAIPRTEASNYTGGASLDTGPIGASIARNALAMQKKWGDKIGGVFYQSCDRLADITVNGATKAFSRFMGPGAGRDTAARTMAGFKRAGIGFSPNGSYSPGDIVYSGSRYGGGAGHVQVIGPDGRFYDQYGMHAKPTTPPQWVVRADDANAPRVPMGRVPQPEPTPTVAASTRATVRSGPFAGVTGSAFASGVPVQVPDADAIGEGFSNSLQKYLAVDKAWGAAVDNTGETTNRFLVQSALATKEFQDQIKATAAQSHLSVAQVITNYRELANAGDVFQNRKVAVDAVTASLKELRKSASQVGQERNPLAPVLAEFAPGGKYAAAPDKLLAIVAAQRQLFGAQADQATREATKSARQHVAVLSEAAKYLTAENAGTDRYQREMEAIQRRYDAWNSDHITGLLKEAKALEDLADKRTKAAKALEMPGYQSGPRPTAAIQKLLDESKKFQNMAAGDRTQANKDARTIISTQSIDASSTRNTARTQADLEASGALAAQIDALKQESAILRDLSLTEGQRAVKIQHTAFSLQRQRDLLRDHSPAEAAAQAESEARQNDEISRLQKRNQETSDYNALLADTARVVRLMQGQTALTLKLPGFSPDSERQLALFEKRAALLDEMEKSRSSMATGGGIAGALKRGRADGMDGYGLSLRGAYSAGESSPFAQYAGFNLEGKLKAFTDDYDAKAALKAAGEVRSILDDSAKAALLFGDDSTTAAIKFRTSWGDLSTQPDDVKKSLIDATAQLQSFADATSAIGAAKSQALDLRKQLETAQLSRRKPLNPLQQQELDWRYDDAAAAQKNPLGWMDPKMKAAMDAERGQVRTLMEDMAREAKGSNWAGKITGPFDDAFDSIISRQKSWGAALRQGFDQTWQGIASDFVKSQFNGLIGKVFGGLFGGAGGGSVLANIVPFAGGSISAGLNSSGLMGGGTSGGGYGVQLHGSHKTGLDFVPADGYLAQLHRGESILEAREAERWRQTKQAQLVASGAGSNGGGSVTVIYQHNGNIVAPDRKAHDNFLQERAQRMRANSSRKSTSSMRELALRGLGIATR